MAEASAAPVVDFHLAPLPDGWISLKDEASGE